MERKVQPLSLIWSQEDTFCAARWKHLNISCLHAGIQVTLEPFCWKWKWKWCGIRPSMVTHTLNLCSAINTTHTAVNAHTHREHTPAAVGSHLCCGTRGAVGCSVSCSRAAQSWYWRWRESWTFTPPHRQFLPDLRLELATFRLRVRL